MTDPIMIQITYHGANAEFPYVVYRTARPTDKPDARRIWTLVKKCKSNHEAADAACKAREGIF